MAESGEKETRSRRMLWLMCILLAVYTGDLLLGLCCDVHSLWYPSVIGCVLAGIYLELVVLERFRAGTRPVVVALGSVMSYSIPGFAIDQYRWLDRFAPAMREHVPQVPWNPVYTLAFGIAVYVVLVSRAIWVYRRRATV